MEQLKTLLFLFTATLVTLLIGFSCGNRRNEIKEKPEKLKKKNEKELKSLLTKQAAIPYEFMSTRISVDLKSTAQNASFSCYVKLDIDDTFGGSIKLGPIVFATYMVTTDSVTFVNKREDCYFNESIAYISTLFGTEIQFDFFQSLLLGKPIGYHEEVKYNQIPADDHYILSTHKERVYKKLENDRFDLKEDVMLIQYHISPASLAVNQINVQVPTDTTEIEIRYLESKTVQEQTLPEETTILITNPKDTLFLRLNYGSIKLNEPKKISINIPDSYRECR